MRCVKGKYANPNGLQARQWKIAQKSAYQTIDRNWNALCTALKPMIAAHKKVWSDEQMHYAYWLVYSAKRLVALMDDRAPLPEKFEVSIAERKQVRNYIRRVVRRWQNKKPRARLMRSFELDADMYSLVENGTTQYVKIMGLTAGKRTVVPLTGCSNFSGNVKVVLDHKKQRIEVHTIGEIDEIVVLNDGNIVALDAGISEVFTGNDGTAYEPTFGKTIKKFSDRLNETGKARNKLHALKKVSDKHKAHRIRKFNLGKQKLNDWKRKGKIQVEQHISQAIHLVVDEHHPATIVTERLDIRGKAKSNGMSRLVSYWMRGSLKERLEFLALVEGFHHKQVNPAYTSQMCPTCLFVHKNNRRGDIFQCLNCGHTDYADWIAANNLLARCHDKEITIYTPKSVLKNILQRRFSASLQNLGEHPKISVSGRTDAHSKVHQSETPLPN